jgi:hypothetical protein
MAVITLEVRNKFNRGLFFKPIQAPIRGTIDFVATKDEHLYAMGQYFDGQPIPGQRIVLDTDKAEGAVYDPLAHPDNATIANKIRERLNGVIKNGTIAFDEPKRFAKVHPATWLHHMKQAVEAGIAVVVSGDINTPVEGEPQREFIHRREPQKDKRDDIIATLIEQNNKLMAALSERPAAKK